MPTTVRWFLPQTEGIGYNISQSGPRGDAYNKSGLVGGQVSRLPIPGLPPITPAPSLAVFADRLAELPLVYEPGTRWSYSVGLDLMGRVIEVVSGQAFDDFLKRSEEHTSELQSLMRHSYAVFCLKKKKNNKY